MVKRWRRDGLIEYPREFVLLGNKKEKIGARSKIHSFMESIDYHYIPALKGKEFFSELLAEIYDVLSDVSAEELKDASKPLQKTLESILGDVAIELNSILKGPSQPKLPANLRSVFRLVQFEAHGIDLDRRGDGIRVRHVPSLVKFLCDLKTQRAGRYKAFHLWGLEEPENSVDFIAAFEMRDQILQISKGNHHQILMATHSPIFFSLDSQEGVRTNFFTQENLETKLSDGAGDISDEMGVLRVVSPYVEKSRLEIEQINHTLSSLSQKLEGDVLDPSRKIVFVEGQTDADVLKAVNEILGVIKEVRFIAGIGDGGSSANAVSDHAIAWHFLQKNRPPDKRVRGVGLVDGDDAGDAAIDRFRARLEGEDNFHSRVEKLRPSKDIVKIYKENGFVPKVSLESLFPLELWVSAKAEGWLDRRTNAEIFGKCTNTMKEKLLGKGIDTIVENDQTIPVIFSVKIGKKQQFTEEFLSRLKVESEIALPFKDTLIEIRGILNKGLI